MRFYHCQSSLYTSRSYEGIGALHNSEDDVGFVPNAMECDWGNHDDHEIKDPIGTSDE